MNGQDMSKYVDFILALELKDISLKELKATVRRRIPPEHIKVAHRITVEHEFLDEGKIDFIVRAEFKFRDVDSRKVAASITISLKLSYTYSGSVEPDEETIEEFKSTSLMLNAWPYIRFWVQTITQSFGWSPFLLPLIKFIE